MYIVHCTGSLFSLSGQVVLFGYNNFGDEMYVVDNFEMLVKVLTFFVINI